MVKEAESLMLKNITGLRITLSDILSDNINISAIDSIAVNHAMVALSFTDIKLTKNQLANFWLYIDTLDLLDWHNLLGTIALVGVFKKTKFIDKLLSASMPHSNMIVDILNKSQKKYKKEIEKKYNKNAIPDETDKLVQAFRCNTNYNNGENNNPYYIAIKDRI